MGQKVLHKTPKNRSSLCFNALFLGSILASGCVFSYGQEGFEGIIVEKIPVTAEAVVNDPNLSAHAIAYRVFVDLDTNYVMQAVFARNSVDEMFFFKTTTEFYNNADLGGTTGQEVYSSQLGDNPALAFDSYVTVNAATNNKLGVLYSEDSSDGSVDGLVSGTALRLQIIGADFSVPFGTENYEGTFSAINAAYNVNGGEHGPTESNRVLIGQFTTDGDFSFAINIQIRRSDGENKEQYVSRNPENLEYQHPALHYPGPVVQLTSPTDSEKVSIGYNLEIKASVSNSFGLDHVEFYVNETKIGTDSEAPYQISWLTVEGTASILAVALDSLGASDTSDIVEITCANVVAPTVYITSPAPSAVFSFNEIISIVADASDIDGNITLVEFYANESKIGEDNTAPFGLNWTPSITGSVNIYAVATDNDNAKTTSPGINITIDEGSGINDVNKNGLISVFPNPTNDKVALNFIGLRLNADYYLEVIDINGKVRINRRIYITDESFAEILDFTTWPQGVYQIRLITNDGNTICSKVVKN